MTTTVTVQAHCNPNTTKVMVVLHSKQEKTPNFELLADGEVKSYNIYGTQSIEVVEVTT